MWKAQMPHPGTYLPEIELLLREYGFVGIGARPHRQVGTDVVTFHAGAAHAVMEGAVRRVLEELRHSNFEWGPAAE